MTNEEIDVLRTLFREEGNAIEQRLRGVIREEVNTAVYASEQRMRDYVNNAIAPLKEAMASMQESIAFMQGAMASINDRVNLLAIAQREMQSELLRLRI